MFYDTKFFPDSCFGLLRRHAISSLCELETINGSASLTSSQLVGAEDGTSHVPVGD